MLTVDKDVGHSALAGLLEQVVLDGRAIVNVVKLNNTNLSCIQVERLDQVLRAGAVGAVRLAEHSNEVLRDEFLVREIRTSAICLAAIGSVVAGKIAL